MNKTHLTAIAAVVAGGLIGGFMYSADATNEPDPYVDCVEQSWVSFDTEIENIYDIFVRNQTVTPYSHAVQAYYTEKSNAELQYDLAACQIFNMEGVYSEFSTVTEALGTPYIGCLDEAWVSFDTEIENIYGIFIGNNTVSTSSHAIQTHYVEVSHAELQYDLALCQIIN